MNDTFKKLLHNSFSLPMAPFYRRYKFCSPVSISSADSRGCVDFELGIFCNRIPKAANSSVMTSLAALKCQQVVSSKEAKKLFMRPSHIKRAQMHHFDELFKFTIVRNPFTRTLSAYLDKVERRAARSQRESSFKDFLYALEGGKLYKNAHWAPQTALFLIPFEQFDFVGHVETFDQDLMTVLTKVNQQAGTAAVNSILHNSTGAREKIGRYYDAESTSLVQRLYHEDFKTLGYSDRMDLLTS